MVLAAPQIVSSTIDLAGADKLSQGLPPSAGHRLTMWSFVVEKIDQRPFTGWGMDGSRTVPQDDRRLAPNMEIMPLHPHNAFLQVRLELGLPGAALAAALVAWLFHGVVGRLGGRFERALMVGTSCAYLTVASLSYGVWQNWWVAFAWVLAALTALAVRAPPETAGAGPTTSAPSTPGT